MGRNTIPIPVALVKEHNVPDILILNADQAPSKYAPTRIYYYGTERL